MEERERIQALPLQDRERERACVRRFHGNLSGVCLVPGDGEELEGKREMRDEEKTIPR